MVDVEITKNNEETFVSKVNCIPIWVNKYNQNGNIVYEVLPITQDENFSNLDSITLDKIKNSYNNTISQIKQSDIINIMDNPFK